MLLINGDAFVISSIIIYSQLALRGHDMCKAKKREGGGDYIHVYMGFIKEKLPVGTGTIKPIVQQ